MFFFSLATESRCLCSLPLPTEDQIVADITHVGEFRLPFFTEYFHFTEECKSKYLRLQKNLLWFDHRDQVRVM